MSLAVAITGTRQTGHREPGEIGDLFGRYLAPWATPAARFSVGGARGIDSLSLLWLAGNTSSHLTVVVPCTVARQPPEARQAIERCRDRLDAVVELGAAEPRTPAFHARNRWMVDRADLVIGFPLADTEDGSGTWQTLDYAAEQGKPRLIVPL
ncbi:hypothetical protein [Streptomyces tagetis]|uniref:Smf/DprA SLOG domain-containing protein n=1 Tax=Streptomyces tagetis TaxID=2820809 RepID=A0A940XJP0_9ACTN|nr:hypothetical protein [Streptomyces sp. RG38]MBQ0829650.1 hypothetical protein [Streptomyces sp. RG38]